MSFYAVINFQFNFHASISNYISICQISYFLFSIMLQEQFSSSFSSLLSAIYNFLSSSLIYLQQMFSYPKSFLYFSCNSLSFLIALSFYCQTLYYAIGYTSSNFRQSLFKAQVFGQVDLIAYKYDLVCSRTFWWFYSHLKYQTIKLSQVFLTRRTYSQRGFLLSSSTHLNFSSFLRSFFNFQQYFHISFSEKQAMLFSSKIQSSICRISNQFSYMRDFLFSQDSIFPYSFKIFKMFLVILMAFSKFSNFFKESLYCTSQQQILSFSNPVSLSRSAYFYQYYFAPFSGYSSCQQNASPWQLILFISSFCFQIKIQFPFSLSLMTDFLDLYLSYTTLNQTSLFQPFSYALTIQKIVNGLNRTQLQEVFSDNQQNPGYEPSARISQILSILIRQNIAFYFTFPANYSAFYMSVEVDQNEKFCMSFPVFFWKYSNYSGLHLPPRQQVTFSFIQLIFFFFIYIFFFLNRLFTILYIFLMKG